MRPYRDNSNSAYELLAEKPQKALREASLKKGQKPPTKLSSEKLISLRDQIISRYASSTKSYGFWLSYTTHKYHPSIAPVSTLTKIYTQDLCLETNHRGSYIILRTITPLKKAGVIVSVVEDENGGCELIQLPVFKVSHDRSTNNFLPKKQIFIVKEPFCKSNTSGELEIGTSICVDHISDVIFLDPNDARVPQKWRPCPGDADFGKTAKNWKDEGNVFFKADKFSEAIERYTKGLLAATGGNDTEIIKTLRLNRSLSFIKISESIPFHENAFEDADYVLKLDPTNEKALYRGAKALYLSKKFEDCKNLLVKLLKHHKNKDAKNDFLRVSRRLQEEKDGKYDFRKFINVNRSGPVAFDCADFVGPILIQDAPNSGRGLFTTRDVKLGELLLFTKSFYIDCAQTDDSSMMIDLTEGTGEIYPGDGEDRAVQNVVQMLYNNPSMISEFLQLHSGDYVRQKLPEEYIDGKPVIDTFLVSKILAHNAHKAPSPNTPAYWSTAKAKNPRGSPKVNTGKGIGIWSSLINHACWSQGQVHRSTIGDVVIIRAAMNIKKGQELTLIYHPGEILEARRSSLSVSYGFTCNCDLCKHESEESKELRFTRGVALREILSLDPGFDVSDSERLEIFSSALPRVLKMMDSLKSTYSKPPTEQPRHSLVTALEFQLSLCSFTVRYIPDMDLVKRVIETVKDIFTALGYEIEESSTQEKVIIKRHGSFPDSVLLNNHAMECSTAYCVSGNNQMAKAWQRLSADLYEVISGEKVTYVERFRGFYASAGYELKDTS